MHCALHRFSFDECPIIVLLEALCIDRFLQEQSHFLSCTVGSFVRLCRKTQLAIQHGKNATTLQSRAGLLTVSILMMTYIYVDC